MQLFIVGGCVLAPYIPEIRTAFDRSSAATMVIFMDDELLNYVIRFFGHCMTEKETLAHRHLLAGLRDDGKQKLLAALAWEELKGKVIPDLAKSLQLEHQVRLSHDPEVLQLTSDGLGTFLKRVALRILTEDRDQIYINKCSSCGALARTPKARQCRRCGFDWHDKPWMVPSLPSSI